ncbi:MAG TPA: hypothetical protein VFJ06_12085 [Halococcus sp.]|nr:hypothetical protein [Halococcus sp.]
MSELFGGLGCGHDHDGWIEAAESVRFVVNAFLPDGIYWPKALSMVAVNENEPNRPTAQAQLPERQGRQIRRTPEQ